MSTECGGLEKWIPRLSRVHLSFGRAEKSRPSPILADTRFDGTSHGNEMRLDREKGVWFASLFEGSTMGIDLHLTPGCNVIEYYRKIEFKRGALNHRLAPNAQSEIEPH